MAPKDLIAQIKRDIEQLPPEQQHDAWMKAFALMFSVMEPEQLARLRAEMAAWEESNPKVCCECGCERDLGILDLIDGHMALRELGCISTRRRKKR